MTYAWSRRRLAAAIRRFKRAETARTPLARLRLLHKVDATLEAEAAVLREEIASLTGEVLRVHD